MRDFQKRLQPLVNESVLANEVAEIVLRDEGRRLFREKKREFDFGYRPNYSKIGRYANPDYAQRKSLLNGLAGRGYVDLQLTGAFVNSLFLIRKSQNSYLFDASNIKKETLVRKYGDDIMGLNQKTFNDYQKEVVFPKIIEFIRRKMGQ